MDIFFYFIPRNKDDDNTDKICYYLKDISNNDSKFNYIDDRFVENMEGVNYKFATQSHVSYQGDPSILFKESPIKSAGECVNYTKYQINETLFQYNDVIIGMSQEIHLDSSSEDDFYYNTITIKDAIQSE